MGAINETIRLTDSMSPVLGAIKNNLNSTEQALSSADSKVDQLNDNLAITDNLSPVLNNISNKLNGVVLVLTSIDGRLGQFNRSLNVTDNLSPKLDNIEGSIDSTEQALSKASTKVDRFEDELNVKDTLSPKLRDIDKNFKKVGDTAINTTSKVSAFAIAGGQLLANLAQKVLQLVGNVPKIGDEFMLMQSRMGLIAGEGESISQVNDKIFDSATRARGSYMDMANSVNKLGLLAGKSFANTDEIVAFSETMQKAFKVGGSGAIEQKASMYQLTQAMAAGKLQGDEFRSVWENAPMLANAISEFTGKSKGELKEMSSQGLITADIIKGALFSASDEINAQFEKMPMTWGEAMTDIQNKSLYVFGDLLTQFNGVLVNGITAGVDWIIQNFDAVASTLLIVGTIALLVAAGFAVAWAIANWPITLIIGGIILLGAVLSDLGVSFEDTCSFIGGLLSGLWAIIWNVISVAWNLIIDFSEFLYNVFSNPLAAIGQLFFDVFDAVLGIIETVAGAIGALFGQDWGGAVSGFRGKMKDFANKEFGSQPGMDNGRFDSLRMKEMDTLDTINSGSKTGKDIGNGIMNKIDKLGSTTGDSMGSLGKGIGNTNNLLNGKGKIGVNNKVEVTDENLKWLKDVATKRWQVTYQNITPQFTANFGDVRETADVEGILKYIEDTVVVLSDSSLVGA